MSDVDESTVKAAPAPISNQRRTHQLYRLAPAVLLTFGVAALLGARSLALGDLTAPGPGLWPVVMASVVAVTATLLIVVDVPDDYEGWSRRTFLIVGGVALLAAFIVLFQYIGFILSSCLMLLTWLRGFARESWRLSILLAIVGAIVLHLIFAELFAVPFPEGALIAVPDIGG